MEVYEQLEPVSIEFMLSTWHASSSTGGLAWFRAEA